jgi:hypothetical protein
MRSKKSLVVGASVVLMLVGLAVPAIADELKCEKVIDSGIAKGTLKSGVVSTDTAASSDILKLAGWTFFSYQSRCTSSSGTAEYDLELYLSAANDTGQRYQYGTDLINNDTTEAWTAVTSIKPPPAAFGWFVIRDNGSTPADTLCDLYFCRGN